MFAESLAFRRTDEDVLTAPPVCGLRSLPDLLRQVQTWCRTGGPVLVVDLSPAQDLEMAVFRALLMARRHCRLRGRDLRVVAPRRGLLPPKAERLVSELLPLHPDLATARSLPADRRTPIPA